MNYTSLTEQEVIELLPDYIDGTLQPEQTHAVESALITNEVVQNALTDIQMVYSAFDKKRYSQSINKDAELIHITIEQSFVGRYSRNIYRYSLYAISGLAACFIVWISLSTKKDANMILPSHSEIEQALMIEDGNGDMLSDNLTLSVGDEEIVDDIVLNEALTLYTSDIAIDGNSVILNPVLEKQLHDFIMQELYDETAL